MFPTPNPRFYRKDTFARREKPAYLTTQWGTLADYQITDHYLERLVPRQQKATPACRNGLGCAGTAFGRG